MWFTWREQKKWLSKVIHIYISDFGINSEFYWLIECLITKQGSTHRFHFIWIHEMLIKQRTAKYSGFAFIGLKLMQELIKRNYRCKPTNIICQSLQSKRTRKYSATFADLSYNPTSCEGRQGLQYSQVWFPHHFMAYCII